MKFKALFAVSFLFASFTLKAEVPPPEKLLPADTLGMMTFPDWDKAFESGKEFPLAQLWRDPAMKGFTEKFYEKLKTDLIVPLERELGIDLADYRNLVHGQVTVAVTQNAWTGQTNQWPGFVALIDTKDKSDQLKKVLAEARQKWID